MTITTAKRPGKALLLTPLALAASMLSAECRADWKFTPTVGVSETYSDNPGLQRDQEAHGQWIAESIPGFTLNHRSRRLRLAASGEWHFYAYSESHTPNTHDRERRYSANAEALLIENLLTLQTRANGSSQAISAFGPRFTTPYSTFNRTDVQTWSISPILQHRFGNFADLRLQVSRDGVKTDGQNKTSAFANSLSNTGSFVLNSKKNAPQALGWTLQYSRQDMETERFGESRSKNASATLSYRLSRSWTALATGGYDSYEYSSSNDRTAGRSLTGGFAWTPTTRTSIDARFGHSYLGKTGSLQAVQRNRHLVSRVSYTDQVTTTRSQFLLPAAIDTAAMLDQLFSATITDPVLRAQAVQAYLAASGLPPTLADSVNYLSNRFIREKRLQAAYIYTMGHSSLNLSVYKSERVALTSTQMDSELLGSQLGSLNDNVRQKGVSAGIDYRLSPRTTANFGLSATRSFSITTGHETPNHYINLGLTHQFDRKTRGNLELRHVHGANGILINTVGAAPGGYNENALAATITVQL
jgi:uncharacterized protein (PEP-CTERM system associated)